ncbi:MAG TPA: helix-turn-helix domain-containing protein [Chloroflexia bacterium]|nr:helix-turn-helix domain-containing protein [Chloroflexia bacterium]
MCRTTEGSSIGVPKLAQQVGLSPSRLSHLFKEQTGLSLIEFQNNQCLQRFLELYQFNQSNSLLQAAFQAGFGSYPQFYRIFRRHVGSSPAQYFQEQAL